MKLCSLVLLMCCFEFCASIHCDSNGKKKFDATFAKLITLGKSGRKFPENKQDELKAYCLESIKYIEEIGKYKFKCLHRLSQQVTGEIVNGIRKQITHLCKKDTKKLSDLIAATPCINHAKPEIDTCYNTLIDTYQGLSQASARHRIPHLCCEYFTFLKCAKQAKSKNQHCKRKQINTADRFVKSMFKNVIHMLCHEYDDSSDKCVELETPPKKRKKQRRSKSFIIPMLEVLHPFPAY